MKQFITDDRRLEQFLFAHFIPFERQIKNERGLTAWVYTESPRLFHVIAEYKALCAQFVGDDHGKSHGHVPQSVDGGRKAG